MLAPYRRLFTRPGTVAFTLAGLLARLSMSMTGVSLVVLISERRGSYALAGTVAAAGLVAVAIGMPLIGRLVDRFGQARVTVPAVLYNLVPLGGLLLCVRLGAPDWTLHLCWAAGSAVPNLGGMARARWAHLLRDAPDDRHLANSLEQALDELCFMTGPVLGMVLCTTVAPEAGMLAAGGAGAGGALLFAAQRRTEPPTAARHATANTASTSTSTTDGTRSPLRVPALRVLTLTFLSTGMVFGALDLTTVAYADALGNRPVAGGLLALVAAGSCVAGLVFGTLRPTGPAGARFLRGVAAMAGLLLLPLAAGLGGAGLALLGVALFVAGTGTAPTMVTGMTLIQELLPQRQLNEAMAIAVSGIMIGISTGSALAGTLAEHAGPGAGYWIPAGAAALALLIALAGHRHLGAGPRPPGRTASERTVSANR
ncbi:MFS transporter [Kitasatospora purpeofusca]|uniref:MFS transporter n=1 Tax=Kitasatospora purpeofusca TaxID=67352 RepID=UPI00225911D4|nr:MFS transporter [Kitasatospora purpeofusca]MCX4686311.1 MFS transporter [Kitasatospora purpeofusca]